MKLSKNESIVVGLGKAGSPLGKKYWTDANMITKSILGSGMQCIGPLYPQKCAGPCKCIPEGNLT